MFSRNSKEGRRLWTSAHLGDKRKRDKIAAVLLPDFMSTEETDMDDEARQQPAARRRRTRRARSLSWESSKLKKYKTKLDNRYVQALTTKQVNCLADVNRPAGIISDRAVPKGAPAWAIKDSS